MVDIKKVIELVQKRGGIIDKTPYHLNLVGVRDTTQINTFNDKLIYFYYDNKGNAIVAEVKAYLLKVARSWIEEFTTTSQS